MGSLRRDKYKSCYITAFVSMMTCPSCTICVFDAYSCLQKPIFQHAHSQTQTVMVVLLASITHMLHKLLCVELTQYRSKKAFLSPPLSLSLSLSLSASLAISLSRALSLSSLSVSSLCLLSLSHGNAALPGALHALLNGQIHQSQSCLAAHSG